MFKQKKIIQLSTFKKKVNKAKITLVIENLADGSENFGDLDFGYVRLEATGMDLYFHVVISRENVNEKKWFDPEWERWIKDPFYYVESVRSESKCDFLVYDDFVGITDVLECGEPLIPNIIKKATVHLARVWCENQK